MTAALSAGVVAVCVEGCDCGGGGGNAPKEEVVEASMGCDWGVELLGYASGGGACHCCGGGGCGGMGGANPGVGGYRDCGVPPPPPLPMSIVGGGGKCAF
jgi:hypothetical protein